MCTLGARLLGERVLIFKNRDRRDKISTWVVRESGKLLIVDEKGHCEGLNEHGIGFVESTLSPHCTRKYKTVSQIGRRILDKETLVDALGVIKRNRISSNVILSDGIEAYIVERTPSAFATTKLRSHGVITNHSLKLDRRNGSRRPEGRASSTARLNRARKLIAGTKSLADIAALLSDSAGKFPIYNKHTISSYIYDLANRTIILYSGKPSSTGKPQIYSLH